MAIQVVIHVHNEDAFLADMDGLPDPTHTYVRVKNPRKRDGKPIPTLTTGATDFLYPWARITFLEIMEGDETLVAGTTTLMSFFREGGRH